MFGSRITDADLKAFMAMVPTLMNTEAGKKSIIRNIQIASNATHARYRAMKELIKENGGKRPDNLALRVEERVEAELDQLAQQFREGFTV